MNSLILVFANVPSTILYESENCELCLTTLYRVNLLVGEVGAYPFSSCIVWRRGGRGRDSYLANTAFEISSPKEMYTPFNSVNTTCPLWLAQRPSLGCVIENQSMVVTIARLSTIVKVLCQISVVPQSGEIIQKDSFAMTGWLESGMPFL